MIASLRLVNFRGFEDHEVPFRPRTWIVGRNNAGKTTLITALTLLSRVTNRWGRLRDRAVPKWLADLPVGALGVAPSITDVGLRSATLFHRYGEPPGLIEAAFTDGSRVRIYLGPASAIWAIAFDLNGRPIPTHGAGATRRLPRIQVLPQVAPLQESEKVLDPAYVRRSAATAAASLHFRNQLFLDLVRRDYWEGLQEEGEHYSEFTQLAEITWPGLKILELRYGSGRISEPLELDLRDGDFVAEAAEMGHGLQMWLQVMWFLARSKTADVIVLDEPEVYTHADIQHRLVRVLEARPNPQIVVTTHSVEILGDVSPADVLVVDRSRDRSGFAGSAEGVQKALERLGGVGSLSLVRLWSARRVLLVEGDDADYLALFHKAVFPESSLDLRALPRVSVGGWSGFPYAVGGGMLLKNAAGENIVPYCVLDSDYHTEEEIRERYEVAERTGVELQIWKRKEIESYVLSPSAIRRTLHSRWHGGPLPTEAEIIAAIDRAADQLRDAVVDRIAEAILHRNSGWGAPRANPIARQRVEDAWPNTDTRWGICNAKELFSRLSAWTQQEFGSSLSPLAVAHQLRANELPLEVQKLVTAIENCTRLTE